MQVLSHSSDLTSEKNRKTREPLVEHKSDEILRPAAFRPCVSTMTSVLDCLESFTMMLGYQHDADTELVTPEADQTRTRLLTTALCPTAEVIVPSLLCSDNGDETHPPSNDPLDSMKKKITIDRASIGLLPSSILYSLAKSFGNLTNTRLQHFARLLVARNKQPVLKNDSEDLASNRRNLHVATLLMSIECPATRFVREESKFRMLPLSKAILKIHGSDRIVILPFVFEVKFFVEILGTKTVQLRLTAPGTIVGAFSKLEPKIKFAEMQIDIVRLYKCMKLRSSQVVKKAFDTAGALVEEHHGISNQGQCEMRASHLNRHSGLQSSPGGIQS